jgi:hypothetical protein
VTAGDILTTPFRRERGHLQLFLVWRGEDGYSISFDVVGQAPDFLPSIVAVKNEISTFVLTMSVGTNVDLVAINQCPVMKCFFRGVEKTWRLRRLSHLGEAPKENTREEVNHGETAKSMGRDAYPNLFIDFDAMHVVFWRG